MKVNFNSGNNKKLKHEISKVSKGDFESMTKMRKEKLAEFEETIQDLLKDYSGENIVIVLQKEDENGLPSHSHMVMAGVSRMECQIAMAKALDKASTTAMEALMESASGDIQALLAIANALVNIEQREEK